MRNVSIIVLVCVTLAALVLTAYVWKLQTEDDPLAAQKLALSQANLERLTEKERQNTEKAKQETALVLSNIAKEKAEQERQATIQATALVVSSRTLAAAVWPVLPLFLLGSAMTGAGLVYVFRRVPVETPFVKASLPVRRAAAIVERSLQVSNSAEMARSLAFTEEISRARMADGINLFKALKPGRETITVNNALPEHTEQQQAVNMPTFQEILANLEPGDQMVFGYNAETGDPITGDFSRLYSSFIGGRSGSGKTSALRGLILQSLKTTPDIDYLIHDPHAEHKESLAQTLPKCRQIRFTGENPLQDVRRFAEALQERIDGNLFDAPPLVFVVDELAYCSRQKYFPSFQAMFDRISTEGRKCHVYLLASSQDLRFRKTGDFRDTLASSFLFNLKSGQVKAFTQDNDLTAMHKVVRVANAPGVALLDLTDGDPVVIRTPFCSPNDARFLPLNNAPAGRGDVERENAIEATHSEPNPAEVKIDNIIPFRRRDTETQPTQGDTETTQGDTPDSTGDTTDTTLFTACLNICENDRKTLSERSGVSLSLIKEIQAGRRRVTGDTRAKLESVLQEA